MLDGWRTQVRLLLALAGALLALAAPSPAGAVTVMIIPYATAEVPIDATRNWASRIQLWNLALDPSGGPHGAELGCPGCIFSTRLVRDGHDVTRGVGAAS